MYVCCLDKCNHCKHLYDLGFRFYFEMGAFLFTSSLKTKNCFCKEMRFFLNNKNALLTHYEIKSPQFFNRLLQAICYIILLCKSF